MSKLREFVDYYSTRTVLPVKISELEEVAAHLGAVDNIFTVPADLDQNILLGLYHRYDQRPTVYGELERCARVVYSQSLSVDWQNLVCAKEYVHVFDSGLFECKTSADIQQMLTAMLGPMTTTRLGKANQQASADHNAWVIGTALLLPRAARAIAQKIIAKDPAQLPIIAKKAEIPQQFLSFALGDDFDVILESVLRNSC
jgi:hypothetical protein